MPKKETDDPIVLANSVLDQIISKHDPAPVAKTGRDPKKGRFRHQWRLEGRPCASKEPLRSETERDREEGIEGKMVGMRELRPRDRGGKNLTPLLNFDQPVKFLSPVKVSASVKFS